MPRNILVLPDDRLRCPSRSVVVPDPAIDRLVLRLFTEMRKARGLGLAAPQLGEDVAVSVVEVEGRIAVLINPVVESTRGRQSGWEGCLSIPHLVAEVPRASAVSVRAQGLDGKWLEHLGTGLFARALLHETDHLAGRLYTDLVPAEALIDTRDHPTPPKAARGR